MREVLESKPDLVDERASTRRCLSPPPPPFEHLRIGMWARAGACALAALAVLAATVEGSETDLDTNFFASEPAEADARCTAMRDADSPLCDPHYTEPTCELLDSKKIMTIVLQGVLALMGIGSLLAKKKLEERRSRVRRSFKVWGMDASKQGAASICAHFAGIINAGILNRMNADMNTDDSKVINTDDCGWYFVSFTLDTTLGVFLSYCMFRLQVRLTAGATNPWVGALGKSGDYEDLDGHGAVDYRRWGIQMAVWCLITVIARLMVLGVQVLTFDWLRVFVAMLSQSMACHPGAMLVLVMVACPVLMNIGMLWIQDQFLKKQAPVTPAEALRASQMEQPKSYRAIQKKVCDAILGFIVFVVVLSVFLWYTVTVGSEQDYYDPCYTQVRDSFNPAEGDSRLTSNLTLAKGHLFEKVHDACRNEDENNDENFLKKVLEHRGDLMDSKGARNPKPQCRCCNKRTPWKDDSGEDVDSGEVKCAQTAGLTYDCSGVGECCGRSQLHDMDKALVDSCSVCPIYMPCDQLYCPARADFIRNTQHLPMIFGVTLSMLGNIYVLYTYKFDPKLQKAAITKLLSWAALVELFFCVSLLIQELAFRIPRNPCVPTADLNGDGHLDNSDCQDPTQWHDWPTWTEVHKQLLDQLTDHQDGQVDQVAGQRGGAVAGCQAMSFIFQLTWTASDSYYWMITVELMLNLYTSPFGSTKKRWLFYHGWTWTISVSLAVWLLFSGDWGVSFDSVLEDFCWNVNFGHSGYGGSEKHARSSNSDFLTPIIYGLSAFYYATGFIGAAVAYYKNGKLTLGLRKARAETITEGFTVVLSCTAWLAMIAVMYWGVVLQNSNEILAGVHMDNGPKDYATQHHKIIVGIWAFTVGARGCVNFLVWRLIVIPRHNAQYENQLMDLAQAAGTAGRELARTLGATGLVDAAGPIDVPIPEVVGDGPKEINEVLMHEVLFFTGLGIRSAGRYPYGEHGDTARATGPAPVSGRLERLLQDRDVDPAAEEADIQLQQAYEYENTTGTNFADNMRQLFSGEASGEPRQSETDRAEAQQERMQEEKERNEHLNTFKFKTYYPKKFRKLREMFNIDIHGDEGMQSLLHQAMAEYKTGSFTGGASGSFMYYSGDKRFIVKQITETEKQVMVEILDDYIDHMERSREGGPVKSLLLRVVQLNRIQMYQHEVCGHAVMRGRMYFVVTENCFYQPLKEEVRLMKESNLPMYVDKSEEELMEIAGGEALETYDLKGSWVGRSTATDKNGRKRDMAGKTQKDNDLQEPLYLTREDEDALMAQIRADAGFLADHDIMDYSLLLGIHKGTSIVNEGEDTEQIVDPFIFHAAAAHHSQRYYVGIIDILQKWDGGKKRETCAKAMLGKDLDGLSSMEPEAYRERFVRAMHNHMTQIDPALERVPSGRNLLMRPSIAGGLQVDQSGKCARNLSGRGLFLTDCAVAAEPRESSVRRAGGSERPFLVGGAE